MRQCKPCSDVQPAPALNKSKQLLLKTFLTLNWEKYPGVLIPRELGGVVLRKSLTIKMKVWVKSHPFPVLHSLSRDLLCQALSSLYTVSKRGQTTPPLPSRSLLVPFASLPPTLSLLFLWLTGWLSLLALSDWRFQSENQMVFTHLLLYLFVCSTCIPCLLSLLVTEATPAVSTISGRV